MVPEIDIRRSAQLLIKQHGKEAGLKADLRVSELTKNVNGGAKLVHPGGAKLVHLTFMRYAVLGGCPGSP